MRQRTGPAVFGFETIFIVQPSKFCLVIFGANFAWLFVLYQGGVIGPTNNPAEFAYLIFETPWYK